MNVHIMISQSFNNVNDFLKIHQIVDLTFLGVNISESYLVLVMIDKKNKV